MNYFVKILVSCFILLLTVSCDKVSDKFVSEEGFTVNQSLDVWKTLKEENGDSYVYMTTNESVFGFGATTEITVINGTVTKRTYQGYNKDDMTGQRVNTEVNYVEENDDVGTNDFGFTPATIDELYDSCTGEYLTVKESENFIYFGTEPNGFISFCSYFPKDCQDDCSVGFSIDTFMFL